MRFFPNLNLMLGTVDARGLASLRADTQVKAVAGAPEISLIRPTAKAAVKRLTTEVTWGIEALDVPVLWKKGLTGQGILVGHLDTGVDGKHPTLKKAIEEFAEFDELGFPVAPTPAPWDSEDHGTHTAATIAGRPVRGRHVGVAPGAKLLSGMVIENGDAVARVLAGMDWALGSGARVLNMSLGFRGYWTDFLSVTQVLREKGVLPVIAVGNEGPGKSRSPGNYVEALSIGAYASDKSVADFSGSQRFARAQDPVVPHLVGPGVGVISAKPNGGYQEMDGSSMATPHIAGLAALLFEAKPGASVSDVEKAIYDSCKRPASMQAARSGRGIPNAKRALDALMSYNGG
jgi:subtilisin family serine protease